MTTALLLLLLDSRAPTGGHNHSAGMEPAIASGMVRDLADVEAFCRTRLETAGRVAGAFAAASCALALRDLVHAGASERTDVHKIHTENRWDELDAEFDARTPSEAMRAASRQLGRGVLRLARSVLPDFVPPWTQHAAHHPIALGAAVAAAGGTPQLAARSAVLTTVSVPASAALRLLGLDPFAVHGLLARLAADIDREDFAPAGDPDSPRFVAGLAADAAPALDLLADLHLTAEVRLFAS